MPLASPIWSNQGLKTRAALEIIIEQANIPVVVDAGLVLSTRERAQLRDNLIKPGITKLSAGSRTNPGGYSGRSGAIEQFEVDDNRSPAQVAAMIRQQGFEPVWKDWDSSFSKIRKLCEVRQC